jgi:hypothetical protein
METSDLARLLELLRELLRELEQQHGERVLQLRLEVDRAIEALRT